MLRELFAILRADNPLKPMGDNFNQMISLTRDMALVAGNMFFERKSLPEERTRIYETDVEVNKLQRVIRKQVVAHLSVAANKLDLPYCLKLMSLVKDVERLGDYAKNLSELNDIYSGALPADDIMDELLEIRKGVENAFSGAAAVLSTSDTERAIDLIRKGRDYAHRSDSLIDRIARAPYDAGTATVMVLASRYYKRFSGHVLNVLSSVVMPLHKLDYYDEDELPRGPGSTQRG
jgi:phosphate transport system protein